MLEHINIKGTDLFASRIALGTWAIGGWMWGGSDEREAIETIHAALDRGINLIDTAPVYGFGHSEEIVGKALAMGRRRNKALIATKAGLDWKNGKPFRNARKALTRRAVSAPIAVCSAALVICDARLRKNPCGRSCGAPYTTS